MDDRPAAIVGPLLIEDAIENTLLNSMKALSKREYNRIFSGNGPLSTFASKIDICNALKLLDNDATQEIKTLKDIRNTFAHSHYQIDFWSPEIIEATNQLSTVERWKSYRESGVFKGSNSPLYQIAESFRPHDSRSRFITSCMFHAYQLWFLPISPDDWDDYLED